MTPSNSTARAGEPPTRTAESRGSEPGSGGREGKRGVGAPGAEARDGGRGPTVTAGSELRIAHRGDGLVVAEFGLIWMALWRKKATPERFKIQKTCLDDFMRRNPSGVGVLCIVEPTSEPPEERERKASSDMITAHGTKIKCVACVVEGSGFRAAITRTVLSGIVLFIRGPSPVGYFASPTAAAAWMAGHMPMGALPRFISQVEGARRYLDE